MKKYFVILFLLALAIFISGCINILPTLEDDSIAPGKGRLKIYLTDSSEKYKANDSEAYSAVYITISRIEAHIAGDDEDTEGEWIVLKEWTEGEEPEFDLITLQDVSELLVDGSFDAGKYTQIRLFVIDTSVDIELGESEVLVEIPSVYQTGLKLIHPFEINDGQTTKLTIDFDAEKSIIKTGNGNYKLKPTIKVTSIIVINATENDNENE
jgi:hypothetical protein